MTKCPDRRAIPRFLIAGMTATLRVSGTLGRQDATVLDFNREGVTLLLEEPIRTGKPVYVSLAKPPLKLDGIVGAVHNCRPSDGSGFRCGVQFRTRSPLQFDREATERWLLELEEVLAPVTPQAAVPTRPPEHGQRAGASSAT